MSACSVGRDSISTKRRDRAKGDITRCNGNCLRCSDGSDRCQSCPLNYFTFEEEIISEKKEKNVMSGILGLFMGMLSGGGDIKFTEISLVTKCMKECPEKHKGKDVAVNYSERKCQ
jgi:hypothetical protein